MNVLSLFSGIGGLDLGLQRAGMTIAGQVEIDPWCRRVLAKHWPEVPRHDDVRTCAEWWGGLGRAADLVCGGFPCQPVSVAGPQLAQADDRWLWPAFASVIRVLRPRFVLVENVPGLLGHGMGDVLGDLAGVGYDAEWDCVPAAFVGAPHIRRRIFLVAYPQRDRPLGLALAAPGNDSRRPHPSGEEAAGGPVSSGSALADPASVGLEERHQQDRRTDTARSGSQARLGAVGTGQDVALAGSGRHGLPEGRIFTRRHSPIDRSRWPAEPDVGRVAHGIPRRVDRLRGLGNAVVPQVAEHIGRMIMEAAA